MMLLNSKKIIFFVFSICLSKLGLCLPDDQDKLIHFRAGQIEWDQLKHQGRLSHRVYFRQGSTRLFAERGQSQGDANHQFKIVTLLGRKERQAHFITLTNTKEPKVHAYADKMVYFPDLKIIQLYGNVYIRQGRYHFRAPYLKYDLNSKKLLTKAVNQQPVTLIIEPEKG